MDLALGSLHSDMHELYTDRKGRHPNGNPDSDTKRKEKYMWQSQVAHGSDYYSTQSVSIQVLGNLQISPLGILGL